MEPERLDALEQVFRNTKPLLAKLTKPFPPVIDAAYLMQHVVEPLDFKVAGGCEYWIRIKPFSGCDRRSSLAVSLFERELNSRRKIEILLCIFAERWDTARISVVAGYLAEKYMEREDTVHGSISEGMLRQLLAGRILYYKNGGSEQSNRRN